MENCVFCKIAKGELKSHKVYEDKEFMAFLDINPNTSGMTLIIPKKHYPSYAFDIPDKAYRKLMMVSKKVAKIIDKNLGVKRTAMVMEGMGINHTHVKLYPLHGLSEQFKEIVSDEKIFFEKYEGYITTLLGPKMNDNELSNIAKKIRGK